MRSMGKDGLDERYGDKLEGTFFEEFIVDPDKYVSWIVRYDSQLMGATHRKLLSHSSNDRTNAELYAMILGEMANFRLVLHAVHQLSAQGV